MIIFLLFSKINSKMDNMNIKEQQESLVLSPEIIKLLNNYIKREKKRRFKGQNLCFRGFKEIFN